MRRCTLLIKMLLEILSVSIIKKRERKKKTCMHRINSPLYGPHILIQLRSNGFLINLSHLFKMVYVYFNAANLSTASVLNRDTNDHFFFILIFVWYGSIQHLCPRDQKMDI